MVGIGAVVVNEDNEVLTVKEKYGQRIQWKLPGGYVEPGNNWFLAFIFVNTF